MNVIDQNFRISYVLLLNYITVKNMNFQVYTYIERVYYPKANRKLYIEVILPITNYVHFLSPFQVHYLKFAKQLRIGKTI